MNLGCLAILVLGLMMLFAGYPIYTHVSLDLSSTLTLARPDWTPALQYSKREPTTLGGFK
jgi:hypothetical protein